MEKLVSSFPVITPHSFISITNFNLIKEHEEKNKLKNYFYFPFRENSSKKVIPERIYIPDVNPH